MKVMEIWENLNFFVTISPLTKTMEGKQSMPSEQVIIDVFLFSSVSFMIEQITLIWGGVSLWVESGAFGN